MDLTGSNPFVVITAFNFLCCLRCPLISVSLLTLKDLTQDRLKVVLTKHVKAVIMF